MASTFSWKTSATWFDLLVMVSFHFEDVLDSKLRRTAMSQGSVPSCLLLDPDFAVFVTPQAPQCAPAGAEAEAAVDDERASVDVNSASTGSTVSLGTHSVAYNDLPVAARALDGMLYNIFKMSIKGSKVNRHCCSALLFLRMSKL